MAAKKSSDNNTGGSAKAARTAKTAGAAKTAKPKGGDAMQESPIFSIDVILKKMKQDAIKNGKTDTEGVLARLEKGVREAASRLASDAERINVINAGRMNHGKSSLLNSIMDSDVFKVNDVRETVVNRRELYRDSIFLTDTPGLEADAEDDSEAFNVYSNANFILFVHTLRIGELHS